MTNEEKVEEMVENISEDLASEMRPYLDIVEDMGVPVKLMKGLMKLAFDRAMIKLCPLADVNVEVDGNSLDITLPVVLSAHAEVEVTDVGQ